MITEGKNNLRRFLRNLETASKAGKLKDKQQLSLLWLRDFFKSPIRSGDDADDIIKRTPSSAKKTKIKPGGLYMFTYLAITPNIPFYDKFPLVIPYAEDATHFWGINLHYAPPVVRSKIFDTFLDIMESGLPESVKNKKAAIIVQLLISHSAFKPLIKCYLKSQVKTRFVEVQSNNWEMVLYLPLARWEGITEQSVYKDYKSKV